MNPNQLNTTEPIAGHLVSISNLADDNPLPMLIKPNDPDVDLIAWVDANQTFLQAKLLEHGGILFRGFGQFGASDLDQFIRAAAGKTLQYSERSSPRSKVEGNIYTSTDHPPNQSIFLHNENSYQSVWPMKIFFLCVTPAVRGGETPIADCRRVYQRIQPELRQRLERVGIRIVRNYGTGMGLPWKTVFGTDKQEDVDAFCTQRGILAKWKPGGGLKTTTIKPRVSYPHPQSGAKTWFNHGTFFHVTTLEPTLRDTLLSSLPEDELPTNTYLGDETRFTPEEMDHLRSAYQKESVYFTWQAGDILMLDNMLTAHGRAPFEGPRQVLVGMAEPIKAIDLQ